MMWIDLVGVPGLAQNSWGTWGGGGGTHALRMSGTVAYVKSMMWSPKPENHL